MAKSLSLDLRQRVMAAVSGGLSCRRAAERFGVSAATAIWWRSRQRQSADLAAKPQVGDNRSQRNKAHAGLILGRVDGFAHVRIPKSLSE